MSNKKIKGIKGSKGGGGSSAPPPPPPAPKEAPNTLQSTAVGRILDVLCEGEIYGLVNGDRSIFLNETALQTGGAYNFDGVETYKRTGTPDQSVISNIKDVESTTDVNIEVTYASSVVRNIAASTDDLKITIQIPALYETEKKSGDINKSEVKLRVYVTPNGGSRQTAINAERIYGKCISPYQRQLLLRNLSQYGTGPWDVEVYRLTPDSTTNRIQNRTYWVNYTEIQNERIRYMDTALIGMEFDASKFGSRAPNRAYEIKGLKIKYPSNYNPTTREYTGTWDGTFSTGYCNNPAWVYYDLLNNDRYGLGLDAQYIDKWTLYNIGVYCDGDVTYEEGGTEYTEPRFVYNGCINTRQEAYHVLNHLASMFRASPLWATGLATLTQDSPKDVSKLITNANVENGLFNYSGSGLKARHTVVNVTWNNINDFCRPAIEAVDDAEGIKRYGYREKQVVAYGTTSRSQARRLGKWILDSEINSTEIVNFRGGWDIADLLPGEVIEIADSHYMAERTGGRAISGSTTSLEIDHPVQIDAGETYSLSIMLSGGNVVEKTLTNSAEPSATNLTWSGALSAAPQPNSVWVLSATDLSTRKFTVVTNTEVEKNKFEITGVYYDANKFARVEEGIFFDDTPTTSLPTGELTAPTNIDVEEYTYQEGQNTLFGVIISWEHTTDPRMSFYELQTKPLSGAWEQLGTTQENSFVDSPVLGGLHDYRVRASGLSGQSEWLTYDDFTVSADPSACPAPSGAAVVGGSDDNTYTGRECRIVWDDSTCYKFKDYKVEVYKIDDTLLRTVTGITEPEFTYTIEMNTTDTDGSSVREFKFKIYVRDVYDKYSESTTLVVNNPAPSMAGLNPSTTSLFNGIEIDWGDITPADNDLKKFVVYCDRSNPPTTAVGEYSLGTSRCTVNTVSTYGTYYAQVEPYDEFGAGEKSNVVDEVPIRIGIDDVSEELQGNLTITDSEGTSASVLDTLYDGNINTGVTYTVDGEPDKYIQYTFPVEDIVNGVRIYPSGGNADIYIGFSDDEVNWYYLKAEADHTLTSDGEMITASSSADAQTNYLSLDSGRNVITFPNNIAGKYWKVFLTGSWTDTIYEIIFEREVLGEFVIAQTLAAINANLGTITAGVLRSNSWSTSAGMEIDLDGESILVGGSDGSQMSWDGSTLSIGSSADVDGGAILANTIKASMIDGSDFGELTISSGSITLNTTESLVVSAGADMYVKKGGDIILEADNSNPGSLKFVGSSYSQYMRAKATGVDFGVGPTVDGTCAGVWGEDPVTNYRWSHPKMRGRSKISLQVHDADDPNAATYQISDDGSLSLEPKHKWSIWESDGSTQEHITFNSDKLGPEYDKHLDLGSNADAWDDVYADDYNNVADFFHFDNYDDIQIIQDIKGSGKQDNETGYELINDDTLHEILLAKDKNSNDIVYNSEGKPYICMKAAISLIFGSIRKLDDRLKKIE